MTSPSHSPAPALVRVQAGFPSRPWHIPPSSSAALGSSWVVSRVLRRRLSHCLGPSGIVAPCCSAPMLCSQSSKGSSSSLRHEQLLSCFVHSSFRNISKLVLHAAPLGFPRGFNSINSVRSRLPIFGFAFFFFYFFFFTEKSLYVDASIFRNSGSQELLCETLCNSQQKFLLLPIPVIFSYPSHSQTPVWSRT